MSSYKIANLPRSIEFVLLRLPTHPISRPEPKRDCRCHTDEVKEQTQPHLGARLKLRRDERRVRRERWRLGPAPEPAVAAAVPEWRRARERVGSPATDTRPGLPRSLRLAQLVRPASARARPRTRATIRAPRRVQGPTRGRHGRECLQPLLQLPPRHAFVQLEARHYQPHPLRPPTSPAHVGRSLAVP